MSTDREASGTTFASVWQSIRGEPLIIFTVCLLGWTLSNLDQSLFGYAVPGIRDEFGSDLEQISWILAASFACAAAMTVVLGGLSDKYGRKRLFVATLAVSAFLVGMQAFATSLLMLGLIRIAAFSVSNGLAPIILTYTVEASPPRLRGLFSGLINCGYPFGWFIGSMAAVPLLASHGWRGMFMPALLVVPLALLLGRWLPESRRFELSRREEGGAAQLTLSARLRQVFQPAFRRRALAVMAANFLFGGAYAGTAFYFPTFYHEFRGYSVADSTYIVGLAYGIGVFGYILAAVVGEFFTSRRNTIAIWFSLGAASLLVVVWLPRSFAQDMAAFAVLSSFFYGVSGVFGTFSAEIFPTHIRATATAFCASLSMYVGFAIFPLVVARCVKLIGWQWAFTATSVPMLILAAIAILQIQNFRSGVSLEEMEGAGSAGRTA